MNIGIYLSEIKEDIVSILPGAPNNGRYCERTFIYGQAHANINFTVLFLVSNK